MAGGDRRGLHGADADGERLLSPPVWMAVKNKLGMVARIQIADKVSFVHAGCGVNAQSGLQIQ
ncbi:hypothetical protein ACNKHS_25145 [Shigella flexneri]